MAALVCLVCLSTLVIMIIERVQEDAIVWRQQQAWADHLQAQAERRHWDAVFARIEGRAPADEEA